jgi:hypothetical protein
MNHPLGFGKIRWAFAAKKCILHTTFINRQYFAKIKLFHGPQTLYWHCWSTQRREVHAIQNNHPSRGEYRELPFLYH